MEKSRYNLDKDFDHKTAAGIFYAGSFLFFALLFLINLPIVVEAESEAEDIDLNLQVNEGPRIIIYDVGESEIGTNSARISWKTNFVAECDVFYGRTTSYSDGEYNESTTRTNHSTTLNGLEAGEKYYYKIYCDSPIKIGQERDGFDFFTSLPSPDFDVTVIGDERKAKINGTGKSGWKVILVFSGPESFTQELVCGPNGKWQFITDQLKSGNYSVSVTYKNEDGTVTSNSTAHHFMIEDEDSEVAQEEFDDLKKRKTEISLFSPDLSTLIEENESVANVVDVISGTAEAIGKAIEENQTQVSIVTGAGIAVGTLPFLFQFNSLADLGILLKGLFGLLTGFFAGRKRRDWGVVYDIRNGQPVPLVTVSIFNEDGRLSEKKVTDRFGAYNFLVPSGKYTIQVEKKGYMFVPNAEQLMNFYADSYRGQVLEVKKDDVIRNDIPMKSLVKESRKSIVNIGWVKIATGVIFAGGFILSLASVIVSPNIINFVIMGIYLAGGWIRSFAGAAPNWGTVVGKNGAQASFAIIKAFEKESGKMVARTVSNEHGRYYLVLDPGEYVLEISSSVLSGQSWTGEIVQKNRSAVKKKIRLG